METFSFVVGASLSCALVSFFSASNADLVPVTSGTTTLRGRNRNSSSASRSSSGISTATHQGSHALWRKTTWLGISGICGIGAPVPGLRSFIRSTLRPPGTAGRVKPGPCMRTPLGPTRSFGPRMRLSMRLPWVLPSSPALPPAPAMTPPPSPSSPSSSAPSGRSMSSAVLACWASSPVLVKTWMRFSSGRPIQRVRGGLTCSFDLPVLPGGISSVVGENAYLSSLSWSAASSATVSGPLAVLLTATSKFAFLRPDTRSGASLVLNSSNGRIPSCSGAAAACLL